jgi:hypothetical protein
MAFAFIIVSRDGSVWTGEGWSRAWDDALFFDREPDPDADARRAAADLPGASIYYLKDTRRKPRRPPRRLVPLPEGPPAEEPKKE